jgi:DNA-binding CsgD family transcriptional regulator
MYQDTEYDSEFNRPMSLGHSLGIGFPDPLKDCERVLVIHRARGSRPFSEEDVQSLCTLQPLLARIYGMSRENEKLWREHFNPEELQPEAQALSPREAEVARLLMHRIPMREIARRLEISPRTVERHALHIYQKVGVSGRRELARVLSRNGTPRIE